MSRPRWLTKVAGGPGAALICVPHAGAGSLAYRTWAPHLAEGMGLMIAVLPGRDRRMREPPAIRAAEVIEPLGAAIAAEHQPHVLFGHSMGALVAFGVTQWLRDNGFPGPLALVVSGSPAPSAMPRADFHRMGDDAFVAMVRSLGGTPEELIAHPGMRARMLSLLRADFALAQSFEPAPGPVPCPILALHTAHDCRVPENSVREWENYTSADFRFAQLAGDHFAPVNNVAGYVRDMRRELAAISDGSGPRPASVDPCA